MSIRPRTGGGSGGAVKMGPAQNVFTGADRTAAEAARDAYAGANAAWLAQYDADNEKNIRLEYDDAGDAKVQYQSRTSSFQWADNESAVGIKGDAGESASVSDAAFDGTWNGDTATAPSKNAVYDVVNPIKNTVETNESFAAATDPATDAATTQAIIDANGGVIITTTTASNNQTLAAPTDTTSGKRFLVGVAAGSTEVVKVNTTSVQVGQVVPFLWDGSAWINDPTQDSLLILKSTGWISGCDISINTDPTKYDISAGVVSVMDTYTDQSKPKVTVVAFGGVTGITPTNLATAPITALAINSSGGVVESNTGFVEEQIRDYAVIGSVAHPDLATITTVNEFTTAPNANLASSLDDLGEALGTINKSGNIISANGANLKLDCSAGSIFRFGVNSKDNAKDPNVISGNAVSAFPFFYTWSDGAGGYNIAPATEVNPSAYDDGTGGLFAPNGVVANNNWSIHRVYVERSTGVFAVQYGAAEYSNRSSALAAIKSENFSANPALRGFVLRCYLVLRGNANDLTSTARREFVNAGKFGDDSASGATTSTTTLQGAYNNSSEPEILTDSTNGAVSVRRGSAADTDNVIEGLNGAGTVTFSVDGNGDLDANSVTATDLSGTLQTAAQPNITSVGTLSSLSVTGTVTHTGTAVVNGAIQGTGDINRTGNATLNGDLTVDSGALVVDATNDRVGMGVLTPENRLHIAQGGTSGATGAIQGMTLESGGSAGINILTPNTETGFLIFGNQVDNDNGFIRYDHTNSSLEFGAAGSEQVVIDSTGLGIGTNLPESKIHIQGSFAAGMSSDVNTQLRLDNNANNSIQINSGTTNTGQIRFGDADSSYRGAINYNHNTDALSIVSASQDRLTIDGSGNVLIGKTTTPFNIAGINLETDGNLTSTRASNPSASFNRLTDDGDIVQFYQDTAEIGSIGSNGTSLYIGANNIEAITIDNTGNVGIGNNSPNAKLEIQESLGDEALRIDVNTANRARGSFSVDENYFSIQSFGIGASGGHLSLNPAGNNVGIGTDSPNAKLDVAGEVRVYPATGTGIIRFGEGAVEKGKISVDNTSDMAFETSGQQRLTIDSTGNVGIGNDSPDNPLTVGSNPTLTYSEPKVSIRTEDAENKAGLLIESGSTDADEALILRKRGTTTTGNIMSISARDTAGFNLLSCRTGELVDGTGGTEVFSVSAQGAITSGGSSVPTSLSGTFDVHAVNNTLSSSQNYFYDVTVTGAAVGDSAIINLNSSMFSSVQTSTAEIDIHGTVTAANTVRVCLRVSNFVTLVSGDGLIVRTIR